MSFEIELIAVLRARFDDPQYLRQCLAFSLLTKDLSIPSKKLFPESDDYIKSAYRCIGKKNDCCICL